MTTTVVNTYLQDVTQNLTGFGDDLLVTSAGSLVETVGEHGVVSTGDFETITIDGLVYSAGGGTAVLVEGSSTSLFVNGRLQGVTGVNILSATCHDFVNVGSQGSIESVSGGTPVILEGSVSSPAATSDSLSNAGDISAGLAGSGRAVHVVFGGDDLINNSGQISGAEAIFFSDNVATETVENSGTITGGAIAGISSDDLSAGINIVNPGLITDGAANVLFFDDLSGTPSSIDNEGTITGSGFVIVSSSDILDINNSGTVDGRLSSVSTVDVENSGHWHDGTGSGGVVFSLSGAGNNITNSHAGTITGAISISGTGDTIDNAGRIDGAITLLAGNDAFTNRGDIDGAVTFTGTGATNTLRNSGTIAGNVTLAGASSTLTNTGTIDGDVTLGASDTIKDSRGEVTGVINAGASDTFDYHGLFGEETIDSFTAGSGSTHDTIQFAANDFGSLTAVRSAMSQVGADTVIRLDATDSITLVGVTKSDLVSADFKFV